MWKKKDNEHKMETIYIVFWKVVTVARKIEQGKGVWEISEVSESLTGSNRVLRAGQP